jgi:hypothetical protein
VQVACTINYARKRLWKKWQNLSKISIAENAGMTSPKIGGPGRDRTDDLFHAI